MTQGHVRTATLAAAAALSLLVPAASWAAPTQVKPGFNLFSVQQDIQMGQQAAQQAERQFPISGDRRAEGYLNELVQNLAAGAPGARYPYQVRLVDQKEINAFSLPGGYLYINRGTVLAAQNEGQLAGVLAHEMAHVALRHGTHQASKAYAAQGGLGVLGAVLGGGRGYNTGGQVASAAGSLGLSALFLKFSRDDETQADIVGSQIMSRAGYDPEDMVAFFDVLSRQQHGSSMQFLSDHPNPKNRAERIRQEASLIGPVHRTQGVGDLRMLQSEMANGGRNGSQQQYGRNRRQDPDPYPYED